MNTPTIKIYRIRHRNDWCGADTIFDSYCLALKKPRKWFNISKFQELFPDWKYVIDETNRKGKEAGKENFFTDSSPETSGDENEESDGETDSELSQTILPQWPIENDQTDDDPLPLPPFKKRKQTRMDDVTSGDQNCPNQFCLNGQLKMTKRTTIHCRYHPLLLSTMKKPPTPRSNQ